MNRVPASANGSTVPQRARSRTRTRAKPEKRLALAVGGVGAFVLFLSVWEVMTALHLLTGMPYVLAGLLAIGIDLGMVVSELASVVARRASHARYWAEAYIAVAVGLSVVLNAAAAASHASGLWVLAAVPVGGVVPVFVFIAGRTAGALFTGK